MGNIAGALSRLLQRHALALDVVLAVVIAVLSVVSLWTPPDFVDFEFRDPDTLGVGLSLLGASAVAFRSRYPVIALAVATAASLAHVHLDYNQAIGGLPVLLTLYSVAVSRPARVSALCTAITLAFLTVVLVAAPLELTAGDWMANVVVLVTGWAVGRSVRSRRAQLRGLEERNRALLAAQGATTRADLVAERSRMAREIQDLVAHSLTEMTVQAAAARRVVRATPEAAEDALLAVEATGRSALAEVRRTLGLLDPDDAGDGNRRPQPGLDELDELVAAERASGLDVEVRTEGSPGHLEPGVALTTYRIVQEALRNAREHAGRARVQVTLTWLPDCLRLTVEDDGRGAAARWSRRSDRDGHGIGRLRDRTVLYGGSLTAGPRRSGGFVVRATLPTASIGSIR